MYVQLRRELGSVFRNLVEQKESRVEEGHLMGDHVHMLLSIPPKYAVSQVVGDMKGKSAIHIARTYLGRRQNYTGSTSGPGASSYRRWVATKQRCANISVDKRRKTSA